MDLNNGDTCNTLRHELSEPTPMGKLVTPRFIYEKYDKNMNNRPDYECERVIPEISWLHYTVIVFEALFLIIMLSLFGLEGTKKDNMVTVLIILAIIFIVVFTLIPYSIKYKISCSQKLFTYQYMSFIPNIFLRKQITINIDDAVYFKEDIRLSTSGFQIISLNYLKLMKVNKNNEEVEVINFGKIGANTDTCKRNIFKAQKMARLLNEIIGFDINLMKDIKKAYVNKDNIALQNISSQMPQDKKNLFQNIFNKMGIDIKLL
jgi:hypothetical protein